MSYRSPKQTYISQQPAYDKLQKDITGAAADIAKKKQDAIETERKRGEELDALGRSASQSYINKKAEYNDVGNQVTQGAVGELFAGSGKRVGEITRLTQGANPQCRVDGNCHELQEELAALNRGPAQIKTFIEQLSDQLDYQNIRNFDTGQNSRGQLASNILAGKGKFNEANGYKYSFKKSKGNSYDIVFEYTGDDEEGGFYNPSTGTYDKTYPLNSASFSDMDKNDESFFTKTPSPIDLAQGALGDAGGAGIYSYTDGKRSGSYDVSKFLADPLSYSSYEISKSNKEGVADTFYGIVDIKKLKEDNRIMGAIASQLSGFTGDANSDIAGEEDGEARAFYNQVLRSQTDFNTFDLDLIKSTMGDLGKDLTGLGDEETRKMFNKEMEIFDSKNETAAFGYRENLTPKQKKLFNALYTSHMLGEIRKEMMKDFESRRFRINPDTSKFINPNSNQDFNTPE